LLMMAVCPLFEKSGGYLQNPWEGAKAPSMISGGISPQTPYYRVTPPGPLISTCNPSFLLAGK